MGAYCLRSAYAVFERVLTPKIEARKLLFYFYFFTHSFTLPDLTSAFGGITTSSVDYRKGHAMMRYVTVNKKEFDFLRRQAYPSVRHGFRPAAYVVLTRVFGHVTEEVHG